MCLMINAVLLVLICVALAGACAIFLICVSDLSCELLNLVLNWQCSRSCSQTNTAISSNRVDSARSGFRKSE